MNPPRNRKGESGSPLPKANASEFYPNHFGDARNGIVCAPNVWEADIALQKSTKLGGKASLEFRAEAFNVFNHRQLGDPSHLDIFSSSNFGQIDTPVSFNTNNDNFVEPATGLGLPRNLQLSLRIRF